MEAYESCAFVVDFLGTLDVSATFSIIHKVTTTSLTEHSIPDLTKRFHKLAELLLISVPTDVAHE